MRDGDEVSRLTTPTTLMCEGMLTMDRIRPAYQEVSRPVWSAAAWDGDGYSALDISPSGGDHNYCCVEVSFAREGGLEKFGRLVE